MITTAAAAAITGVDEVRRFLQLSECKSAAVKQILENTNGEMHAAETWASEVANFTSGRTYDYACATILLYGVLERFVEDLAIEYMDALTKRHQRYSNLPDKLRKAHFDQTVANLSRTRDSRYNGNVDASQLAASLSSCLSDSVPYNFLPEPLIHHSANFRVAVVDEFLGRIDIPSASRRALETHVFAANIASLNESQRILPSRFETAWSLVNDLVERRNQVAHGDTSNALAPSGLEPYCAEVKAYCLGLAQVARDSVAQHLAFTGLKHGKPIKVFNHNIVCIMSKGATLRPGSLLACNSNADEWYALLVEEVQVDNQTVAFTTAGEDVAVGLRTDGRCKESYTVFSIP